MNPYIFPASLGKHVEGLLIKHMITNSIVFYCLPAQAQMLDGVPDLYCLSAQFSCVSPCIVVTSLTGSQHN